MSAKRRAGGPPKGAVIMVLVALLGLAGVFVATRPASADHPEPRGSTPAVMSPSAFAGYPRIQETYRMVAEIPHVIDGLFCYCECEDHSGHYSLLDCFRDEHGAGCDICMTEAQIAYRMTKEGRSLQEIRAEIDGLYDRHSH